MELFEKKKEISRKKFRERLRKAPSRIPGGGVFGRQKRVRMERELFPKERFRGYVSEREFNLRLRELKRERYQAKTSREKQKIDREIRFLKELKD